MNSITFLGWAVGALPFAFQIWMAVHAIRTGRGYVWLMVIFFLGPIGAAIYFFMEYVSVPSPETWFRTRHVRTAELNRAEADTRRLDNAPAWTDYATLLRGRRRHSEAAEAARRALERKPGDLEAQYERGRALLALGQHAEAVPLLADVVTRDPGHDQSDGLMALPQAQEGAGDDAGARQTFESLAARSSRPEILCHLAEVQLRMGDRDAARLVYQRVVDEAVYSPKFSESRTRPWVNRAQSALKDLGA